MKRLKTWVEIDRSALRHNLKAVSSLVKPASVMAVVKADAYGHGLIPVAQATKTLTDWFGVDSLDEAVELRRAGIKKPILVLGYIPHDQVKYAVAKNIAFVAYNVAMLKTAAKVGTRHKPARIHIKVETGLNRQGADEKSIRQMVQFAKRNHRIRIEGASTHYANVEDGHRPKFSMGQLRRFRQTVEMIERELGQKLLWKHTACSAAAVLYPEMRFNLIRLGIMLYGLWSGDETRQLASRKRLGLTLRPVLAWKTIVAQVKSVAKGSSVGYGLSERVRRDSKIAVLPIGYGDGYDRMGMSWRGEVLIHGKRAKVVGRVCMNMCMVDVTRIRGVRVEDEVVLIGRQGKDAVTAEEIAEKIGSNVYEAMTNISPLVPKVLV